jgi:hypothetical protein
VPTLQDDVGLVAVAPLAVLEYSAVPHGGQQYRNDTANELTALKKMPSQLRQQQQQKNQHQNIQVKHPQAKTNKPAAATTSTTTAATQHRRRRLQQQQQHTYSNQHAQISNSRK